MDIRSVPVFQPLDGSNYSIWKVIMRVYIKSIDERAWLAILTGWSPPKVIDVDGDYLIKPESNWTDDEVELSNFNSKALIAIFDAVDMNMFKIILNYTAAKDAWEALQKYCEGSSSVRQAKLRLLTTKFENLRMEDDEEISSYNRRLCDIAFESQSLGDAIPNVRLVSKMMRSLPKCFNKKICAIEKAYDTTTLRLDELVGILQTYELNLSHQRKSKGKGIAHTRNIDSIQCRACTGYGHYAAQCANTRRKRGVNICATLSDSDDENT